MSQQSKKHHLCQQGLMLYMLGPARALSLTVSRKELCHKTYWEAETPTPTRGDLILGTLAQVTTLLLTEGTK